MDMMRMCRLIGPNGFIRLTGGSCRVYYSPLEEEKLGSLWNRGLLKWRRQKKKKRTKTPLCFLSKPLLPPRYPQTTQAFLNGSPTAASLPTCPSWTKPFHPSTTSPPLNPNTMNRDNIKRRPSLLLPTACCNPQNPMMGVATPRERLRSRRSGRGEDIAKKKLLPPTNMPPGNLAFGRG